MKIQRWDEKLISVFFHKLPLIYFIYSLNITNTTSTSLLTPVSSVVSAAIQSKESSDSHVDLMKISSNKGHAHMFFDTMHFKLLK